jgi:hypothetical protein
MRKNALLVALLVLPLAACKQQASEPAAESSAPTVAEAPGAGPSSPLGPISSRGEVLPEAPAASMGTVGRIDLDLPADWESQTPDSEMRLRQAAIPGPGGAGQFALFYFGPGGGGGVQANLDRWTAQMQPKAGYKPQSGKLEANGYVITWIEVEGTLLPSTTGMGPGVAQPDSVLLAAVVEGTGGPWFVKATGPAKTMKGQREAFFAMLKSIRAG